MQQGARLEGVCNVNPGALRLSYLVPPYRPKRTAPASTRDWWAWMSKGIPLGIKPEQDGDNIARLARSHNEPCEREKSALERSLSVMGPSHKRLVKPDATVEVDGWRPVSLLE